MKLRAFACAALALLALPLAAQKSAEEAAKPDGGGRSYAQHLRPGEQHKNLDQFVGSWKASLRIWGPGNPPRESQLDQTMETRWVLDGHFLETNLTGTFLRNGVTFNQKIFRGYNSAFERYSGYLMPNVDVRDVVFHGTYDAATKTFTFKGEEKDPILTDSWIRKEIFTFKDPDHMHIQTFLIFQDGSEAKIAEGVFERVGSKPAAAPEPKKEEPKKEGKQ